MIVVQCAMKNCESVYRSDERASSQGVRYVCSHHTDKELRAAGVLKTNRADKDVHFQTVAFDKKLRRGRANQRYTKPLPERPSTETPNIFENQEPRTRVDRGPDSDGDEFSSDAQPVGVVSVPFDDNR